MTTGKDKLLSALEAYFAAFALANIGGIATTSILSLVFFILCFQVFLLAAAKERAEALSGNGKLVSTLSGRRRKRAAFLLALLYTCFYLAAQHASLTGSLENPVFCLLYLAMTAVGLFVLFRRLLGLLLLYLEGRSGRISGIRPGREKTLPFQLRLLLFVLLLACWFPWFLVNFPGVMTPDSLSQYSQAMGLSAYSNHHPFVHTLLIKLFLKVGLALFHNEYAAIACYTLFQMLLMALIVLTCLCVLFRQGAGKKLCFLFLLFYALVPYNGIFAVTMWKDILFSGFLLLFVLSIYQLLPLLSPERSLRERPGLIVQFFLSGLLVCLMRSNGLYAFAITAPFLLWASRKKWKLALPALLCLLAAAFLIKGPLFDALGVEKPAFSESLSIPAQQIARVVYEGRVLTEEEIALLSETVDYASIADYYQPTLADPVKALIQYGHPEYLEEHKAEYLKLWIRLGLKYPLDYFNAFVDQTSGYWFPAAPGLLTNEGISPNELGLAAQPILRGQIVWKISEIISKLYTICPLYGLLYSIGAFTWTALFLFTNCLLNGRKENRVLFVPFFAILITLCLATPVASDMRYAYPLVFAMPLLIHAGLDVSASSAEPAGLRGTSSGKTRR